LASFLIIGGDGIIGHALKARLQSEELEYVATTRRRLSENELHFDLATDPDHWPELPKAEVVFFCAAATKLDACEDNPEATRLINVTHMQALAAHVQSYGGLVVFLSSNQVFDGSKPYRKADETQCPVSEYGRQKAEFEQWLSKCPTPSAILRLTKVITGRLPITEAWQEKLESGAQIEAFDDLTFSPLPIKSVLDGLMLIGKQKKTGIFQLSGRKQLSYYDIACKLAVKMGKDIKLVTPVSAKNAGIRPQFLPRYGTLDCSTMADIAIAEIDCLG